MQYTDAPLDSHSGLTYLKARYYNADIGRFYAVDPLWFRASNVQSFNPYAYANNSPYVYTDPTGTDIIGVNPEEPGDWVRDSGGNIADPYNDMLQEEGTSWAEHMIDRGHDNLGGAIADHIDTSPVILVGGGFWGGVAKAASFKIGMIGVGKSIGGTVGELRAAGLKDAHHIIQDAAAKNLSGYSTNKAPGIQLTGPANKVGTPHHAATQVQRQAGGGTYQSERRIGYKALRKAGVPIKEARQHIQRADNYFKSLGVKPDTPMRKVKNRRGR